MPQPALRVSPASTFLCKISCMESTMVPDTVQLMVEVAGLYSLAPALAVMRPAGMAPFSSAQRNCLRQCAFCLGSSSARASATRSQVPLTVLSTLSPWWSLRWYFWAQMSQEASCSASNSKVGCWSGVSLLDLLFAEDYFVEEARRISRLWPKLK